MNPDKKVQGLSWLQGSADYLERLEQSLRLRLEDVAAKEFRSVDAWHGAREALEELAEQRPYLDIVFAEHDLTLIKLVTKELRKQSFLLMTMQRDLTSFSGPCFVARFRFLDQQPAHSLLTLRRLNDDREWLLDYQTDLVFGRSRECHVLLASMHASAHHCSLSFRRRAVGLVDLQSASGSFLDNRRMRQAVVDDYGLICLGRKETGHYLEMELKVPLGSAPYLHVISGVNAGQVIPLLKPVTTLGRGSNCDQKIIAPYISRQHLRLTLLEDVFFIEDHASANGTRINERGILSDRLLPGDLLDAAGERFEVVPTDAEEPQSGEARVRIGAEDYPLCLPVMTIGSHGGCDINVSGKGLNRYQARFVWRDEGRSLWLYDLGGVTPSAVNGELVAQARLSSGDQISFGRCHAQVFMSGEATGGLDV